jgi:hypothetical protein
MNAFRALLQAAVQFEKKAARHKRIDAERKALAEAITQAQLILSVADGPTVRSRAPFRSTR